MPLPSHHAPSPGEMLLIGVLMLAMLLLIGSLMSRGKR